MNKKDIGDIGERAAARFLKKQGYKVLGRNLHLSHNELDIVALNKKEKILAFVEVKARSVDDELYSSFGSPASAVNKGKRERTVRAARAFLTANPKYGAYQPRLDVVEVYLHKADLSVLKINHIENAFGV